MLMQTVGQQEAEQFAEAKQEAADADLLTRAHGIETMFRLAEIGVSHVRRWATEWLLVLGTVPNPHRMEKSRAASPKAGCLSR